MNLWIRIDAALPRDPNVQELTERLGVKRAEAVGLLTCLWGAIAEHRPTGDLTGVKPRVLEDWAGFEPRGRVRRGQFALVFIELFTRDGFVRGWRDRQGKLIELAEKDRKRKRKEPGNSTEVPKTSTEAPRKVRGGSTVTRRDETERDETRRDKQQSDSEYVEPAEVERTPRDRFLDRFYGEAPPGRRAEIDRQLDQLLKPEGLRVSEKLVVRASSQARLNTALSDVLRGNPLRNPDSAIVVLFRKLNDPDTDSAGHTATEATSAREREQDAMLHRWNRARQSAVEAWVSAHKAEADQLEILAKASTDNEFSFRGRLLQELTKVAEFPEYEIWLQGQKVTA